MKKVIHLLFCPLVLTFALSVSAAPHKLRVEDPVLARDLVAQGAKVIGDYGTFTVLSADDSLMANGVSNRVEVSDQWNLIRLNARPLNTSAPEVKALRKTSGTFAGRRLHLVQFAGPVKPRWLAELKENGVQIVSYIPENAYLIYGDAPALARVQTWAAASDFAQWEGDYTGDLKVHTKARELVARRSDGTFQNADVSIQLITDTNANTATMALIDRLKTAPVRVDYPSEPYRNLVVSVPSDQLDTLAAQPDVVSIHPFVKPKQRDERQDQIIAGNLIGTAPSGPGYLAWLVSKGFTQAQFDDSGFVVDVADSGIDNGTTSPGHFGLYRNGDTSQSSRVAYTRFEPVNHVTGTLSGCDGHGTLNSHIIGNYDDFIGYQHKDSAGFSYGVGVCPFVKVGSSVIFDNSVPNNDYTFPDFNALASDAYGSGARIGNNSWGTDVNGDYDAEAQTYDKLVRDAQSGVSGNQQMIFVFAAGNAGICTPKSGQGIDSPGSAKNVITVGAADNVRSLSNVHGGNSASGMDGCGETDLNASSADDITCSSSRGPCKDGRMKPDLVAPGVHITGGVPQNFPPPSAAGLGSALDCFDAMGVCALPGSGTPGNTNNFFPLGQQFYTVSTGTSHSTPVVAGACALVRQYFINNSQPAPSPAMTKAFLMNSARYLTGSSANDNLWSPNQGMGEVNLGVAFDGVTRFLLDQTVKFTATGQRLAYAGQVTDATKPFRVTIAWTDAPGSTTASAAYNNNLDLVVAIGGKTYKGNVFSGQYSTIGGAADPRNNVESVFLPAGVTGDFTVLITAANINSDGVPNEAPSLDQDFALVIYNGNATNEPTFTPVAAGFNGLFSEPGGPELGRSGAISLTTTASGAYSGKLQIGSKSFPFSGTLDLAGNGMNAIVRKGASTLGLSLNIDLNSPDTINGTVTDPGNWTATLRANQAPAKNGAVSFGGNYTFVLVGSSFSDQFPGGDSYGTVNISTAGGKLKLTGSLADGTKLAQSAVVSASGQWPFYVSPYGGQGQLFGWLTATNGTIVGNVNWIKNAMATAKVYPNGFNYNSFAKAYPYNPAVFNFNPGLLQLTGAGISITNLMTVNGSSVTGANASLSLSSSKGTFKGSFTIPPSKTKIPFNGVFLQPENVAAGYFLNATQSGQVSFGPPN